MEPADGETGKKRKAGGGFQKPFNLSETLSELVGETQVRDLPHVIPGRYQY
jgi:hypothetical protein